MTINIIIIYFHIKDHTANCTLQSHPHHNFLVASLHVVRTVRPFDGELPSCGQPCIARGRENCHKGDRCCCRNCSFELSLSSEQTFIAGGSSFSVKDKFWLLSACCSVTLGNWNTVLSDDVLGRQFVDLLVFNVPILSSSHENASSLLFLSAAGKGESRPAIASLEPRTMS